MSNIKSVKSESYSIQRKEIRENMKGLIKWEQKTLSR
jgi:hypothetical protein